MNATANASVNGPTLPANIVAIMQSLEAEFMSAVIPVVSPTVPKAETTSNKDRINEPFICVCSPRKNDRSTVKTNIHASARKNMTNDSLTICWGTERPNAITRRLFFSAAITDIITTANVQVFMPPPVEPGDAPINIRSVSTTTEGTERPPMGRVLNPAVLAVTDWNTEPHRRCGHDIAVMTLFFSNKSSAAAPKAISANETASTIFDCKLNLLETPRFQKRPMRSRITINPMPPRKIRPIIVRLIYGSASKRVKLSRKSEKPALQNPETA